MFSIQLPGGTVWGTLPEAGICESGGTWRHNHIQGTSRFLAQGGADAPPWLRQGGAF